MRVNARSIDLDGNVAVENALFSRETLPDHMQKALEVCARPALTSTRGKPPISFAGSVL